MRVKFLCTKKMGIETFTVHLEPVLHVKNEDEKTEVEKRRDGSVLHPNADLSFFAGHPYGSISLSALSAKAGAEFEENKETWINFELAK